MHELGGVTGVVFDDQVRSVCGMHGAEYNACGVALGKS